MEEYSICSYSAHKVACPEHQKDKVPKRLFYKNPDDPGGKLFKTCIKCRKYSAEWQKKSRENLKKLSETKDNKTEFQACPSPSHSKNVSDYPREKVPRSHFTDDIDNPKSKKYVNCFDCRNLHRNSSKNKAEKIREKAEKNRDSNSELISCFSTNHGHASSYKREEVPRILFRKYPEDPKSPLLKNCLDCRKYSGIYNEKAREKKKESVGENEFYCPHCHVIKSLEEKGTNLDGSESACCIQCKTISHERMAANKNRLIRIKTETILKNNCSCVKCKKIYLSPEENKLNPIELPTYEKNGTFYVKYQDTEHPVDFFLKNFQHLLELRILEFDHLTEKEQRERGILKDTDVFVPKREMISQLTSDASVELELLKVQLLCSKCHLEETIEREIGIRKPAGVILEKSNYVNELKKQGCSSCGFYDPKLHRFLEFDHLDPAEKEESIAEMVISYSYDLNDIIKETDKKITRILCKFCHTIHTSNQNKLKRTENER